jgi:type IV pilus assembly protein PilX
MKFQNFNHRPGPASQRGVSLLVAMVMLIVLTLIGVSSMNTAVVELKMAGSSQQQALALNRANETLRLGEQDVIAIVNNPGAFDFASGGDAYYIASDNIDVAKLDWDGQGLDYNKGNLPTDAYVTEYLGIKDLPGETAKESTGNDAIGGAVHTFRITSRSATGKSALRLVQSIYVTLSPP